jgi:hypothetical protein
MSVHLPVEHLMRPAMFCLADLLSVQGTSNFRGLGTAGLAEHRQ